jgi:hypothetical protein
MLKPAPCIPNKGVWRAIGYFQAVEKVFRPILVHDFFGSSILD